MTGNPIRVSRSTDANRFLATDQTVWFQEVSAAPIEEQLLGLAEEQRFAAEVDGADASMYPGIYGVFPLTLSAPGPNSGVRPLPCAGLTWVGVHPDHRRKGVLTAMMKHHFEQVHAQDGTYLSALHSSEPAIYGRYGYGWASSELEVGLSRGTTLTAPDLESEAAGISTAVATVADADVPERIRECHVRCAGLGSVVGEARALAGDAHRRQPDRGDRILRTQPKGWRSKRALLLSVTPPTLTFTSVPRLAAGRSRCGPAATIGPDASGQRRVCRVRRQP